MLPIKPTPNIVKHENLMRSIDVGGNVKGRDLGSVAADVERPSRTSISRWNTIRK